MSKPLIFCDLDGVLADWSGTVARHFGFDPAKLPADYNIARALGIPGVMVDLLIKTPGWWENLPTLPWTHSLFEMLTRHGDVFILSTPWRSHPECHTEKVRWCKTNLGLNSSRVILTEHKELLAAPGRILVDDSFSNTDAWMGRNGSAVSFPHSHHGHHPHSNIFQQTAKTEEALLRCFELPYPSVQLAY